MEAAAARIALAVGIAIAVLGVGVYQAWWTVAFAIGGVATALLVERNVADAKSIVAGVAMTGAVLLICIGLFALYAWMRGPAVPCTECADSRTLWLLGAAGSAALAIALLAVARRASRRQRVP